jgi:itaconate CoA-transferase
VLQQPKLATDARFASNSQRVAARRELRAIIEEAFAPLTSEQVIERLDGAQIANAHMNDMHDVWQHAQLKARERWVDIDTPAGSVPALLPPGLPNAYAPRMDGVPALGEQTEAILTGLGYSSNDIARLRAHNAI